MSDGEQWEKAVAAVTREYGALPPDILAFVEGRAVVIRGRKQALHELARRVNGAEICAACRGECCARGKNHFTVVDLLVHLSAGQPLFTPRFGGDHCPYLGADGCFMAEEFRPFNCITFHCERVEGLLAPPEQERFRHFERELRVLTDEMEEFFGNRFRYGLLVTYERSQAGGGGILLRRMDTMVRAGKG